MIPAIVSFTGYSVNPSEMLFPRLWDGPIPNEWLRIQFEVHDVYGDFYLSKINSWISENFSGNWAIYNIPTRRSTKQTVILAFEKDNDAVMFRLMGGETAWALINDNF